MKKLKRLKVGKLDFISYATAAAAQQQQQFDLVKCIIVGGVSSFLVEFV